MRHTKDRNNLAALRGKQQLSFPVYLTRNAARGKSPRGKDEFPAPDYVAHIGKRRHVVRWIGSQDH
jgi:hypothetical protein